MMKAPQSLDNEASLASIAARLQSVLDTVVDGIITIDERGGVETFNLAAERIFGYAAAEVIGHNIKMLMPEPYHCQYDGQFDHCRATNEARTTGSGGELAGLRKDGSTFPMELAISEMWLGEQRHFTGIVRDIRGCRQAETQLDHLFDLSLDMLCIASKDGLFKRVNPAFTQVLGWSTEEILARPFLDFVHPDDQAATLREVERQATAGEKVTRFENRYRHNDGSWRMLSWMSMPGENGLMFATARDVTERTQADAQMTRTIKELADFKAALDEHAIVATTDARGTITYANDKFCAISKYAREELIGQNHRIINSGYHPQAFFNELWQTIASGRIWKGEIKNRARDGTFYWVDTTIVPFLDGHGQPVQYIAIREDITKRKLAEEALIVAREEADRANQAKSEFLSSMSHELRTPMNAILGFGQLMEYDDTLPDEHKDNLREILKAGHHLLELINEVLDLTKVESGRIDLSLEPVYICAIIEECLNLISTLADKRDIQLSHNGLKGAAVRADRTRLRQVLLNLLSNAIKYNRDGGSVRLDVRPEGTDRLRIRVTDTGTGIPAARLAELFQPFNRLDAENSGIEGTGIGLTITRRIVEMMGGTVDVESEVGVGSTFWIELPLESAPESAHGHEGAAADSATPAPHIEAAQHIVLYIEDNPSNLKLVAQFLGRHQHIHLLTAHTPELGIELARARRPELILLDINMPGMDGYQVLKVFKADTSLKTIPVVAITANAMPRDIERGKKAGFSEYMTKPLDMIQFHAMIDRQLSRTEGDT